MKKFAKWLKIYIRLTRWEDYITFLQFVFGFFLAKSFSVTGADLLLLGKTLFVLAPLLYGGIYTLNNIKDAELDKLNPKKRGRPIPAGEISKEQAAWIAAGLIGTGLLLSLFLPPKVFLMALIFLFVNIMYTFWAKGVPYLSIITNSATHVLRLIFGMWLAGDLASAYLAWVLGTAALGATIFRYIKEISEGEIAGRPVLKSHTAKSLWRMFYLVLTVLALFIIFGRTWERIIGAYFLAHHLISGFGYSRQKRVKKLVDFTSR